MSIGWKGSIVDLVDMEQNLHPIDQLSDENEKNKVVKLFKCNLCDFASSPQDNYKVHLRVHTGERPFKCTLCNYKAKRMYHLKTHLKIHTGEKSYKCNKCEFAAAKLDNLRKHRTLELIQD